MGLFGLEIWFGWGFGIGIFFWSINVFFWVLVGCFWIFEDVF